jgi:hypothetical protein
MFSSLAIARIRMKKFVKTCFAYWVCKLRLGKNWNEENFRFHMQSETKIYFFLEVFGFVFVLNVRVLEFEQKFWSDKICG